jgi:hypothetical protein
MSDRTRPIATNYEPNCQIFNISVSKELDGVRTFWR